MTAEDKLRLTEIKFYLLVFKMVVKYNDYAIIVDMFDILSKMFDCNPMQVSQIVLLCIKKDPAFAPKQSEAHVLLYKSNMSIRNIVAATECSNQTFYSDLDRYTQNPYPSRPRLSTAQQETISRFMQQLEILEKIFKVW